MFELVNHGGGNYTPTTLLSFTGANGEFPFAGLIADAAGDLFGTTATGGASGDGTVFELVNHGGGNYTPTTLLSFTGANGEFPFAGLIADAAGDLFGTTSQGGTNGDGTVFEITDSGFVVSQPLPPIVMPDHARPELAGTAQVNNQLDKLCAQLPEFARVLVNRGQPVGVKFLRQKVDNAGRQGIERSASVRSMISRISYFLPRILSRIIRHPR